MQNKIPFLKLGLLGASGKMGQALLEAVKSQKDMVFCALHTRDKTKIPPDVNHKNFFWTQDAGKVFSLADLVIDFSHHSCAKKAVQKAIQHKTPYVTGVTGSQENVHPLYKMAGEHIALLACPNFSFGSLMMHQLSKTLASNLDQTYQVRISETHHIQKKDAPSGTAKSLAELVENQLRPKTKTSGDQKTIIPIKSFRVDSHPGQHSISFSSPREEISISHTILDRSALALGVLKAARWLYQQPTGFYQMEDLFIS